MTVKFFCPLWGQNELPFEAFCKKVKAAGYDGVEMGIPLQKTIWSDQIEMLEDHGLQWIGQHYQTLEADFDEHREVCRRHLENLVEAGPLFINSQTGKDHFTFGQNEELIELAFGLSLGSGTRIYHETHRGKFAFAAHVTREFCQKIPDLKLTLDISHWCNVAESFLQDQQEAVSMALDRTEHIHSRVGYTESAQVGDPRAPEWKPALDHHLSWWDRVIERMRSQNRQTATITVEFGPYPYMVHLPYTQKPIADQWEVNLFMRDVLRKRYGQ